MLDTSKEYIICAANWYNDGKKHEAQPDNITIGFVTLGMYHNWCIGNFYLIRQEILNKEYYELEDKCTEGFLTSKRRFVEREEAGQLALACGQIKKMSYFGGKKLDSSDLYH